MQSNSCDTNATLAKSSSKVTSLARRFIVSLEMLMVDINLILEGKKFPTLTSVQELFNITDSKFILCIHL